MNTYQPFDILHPATHVSPLSAERIRIEPAFWWCGMQNPELQLLVYGKDIAEYRASIHAAGVYLSSCVLLENPHYLLLYLHVGNAQPGIVNITFTKGKNSFIYPYELKARHPESSARKGFDASDVVYLIMPDRFAQGKKEPETPVMRTPYRVDRKDPDARHGGNLAGIEQRLDYLSDLGVTAIWLTPVLENDMEGCSYHGYAITDYYRIDPRMGSNEEYRLLVEKAHGKGIRVIMDMIFNHCGSSHIWMREVPCRDWFNNLEKYVQTNHAKEVYFDPYASDYDRDAMVNGWFVPSMPDLNQQNPHLATYLIQNSIWWIEYAGIDGIRQDTFPYADREMMTAWCRAVMREYPDFTIVGEAWMNYTIGSAYWQKGCRLNPGPDTELKAVMDFRLLQIASQAFSEETEDGRGLQLVFEHLCYDFVYPDIYNVLRFLENHDTDRFLPELPDKLDKFKQAMTFLLTIPGIPQLYYGQELLMNGSKKRGDGYIRQDIPGGWPEDKINLFEPSGRSDLQQEAWLFVRTLLRWRRGNKMIAYGKMKHFTLNQGVYVYERSLDGKSVLIMLNGCSRETEIPLDRYAEVLKGRRGGHEVLSGEKIAWGETMKMGPREVRIIELE